MRRNLIIIAMALTACQSSSGSGPASPNPPEASAPKAEPCIGTVTEYCQGSPDGCPTFEQSVVKQTARCTQAGTWSVVVRECPGSYRSVAWHEAVLGGGEEYFNAEGVLGGAHLETDYRAYCGGSSFSEMFGSVPTCASTPIAKNLCGVGGA